MVDELKISYEAPITSVNKFCETEHIQRPIFVPDTAHKKLLDTVALTENWPAKALARGQVGTIVEELGDGMFEVEFSDETGEAYAFPALPEAALMKLVYRRTPAEPAQR